MKKTRTGMISKEMFDEKMKILEAAFMKEMPKETLKIYWEFLENSNEKEFIIAIENIIKAEFWFPPIAKIKEYVKGKPVFNKQGWNVSYDPFEGCSN